MRSGSAPFAAVNPTTRDSPLPFSRSYHAKVHSRFTGEHERLKSVAGGSPLSRPGDCKALQKTFNRRLHRRESLCRRLKVAALGKVSKWKLSRRQLHVRRGRHTLTHTPLPNSGKQSTVEAHLTWRFFGDRSILCDLPVHTCSFFS